MTTATLQGRNPPATAVSSPLPQLLQTPTGLALLELQGTINLTAPSEPEPEPDPSDSPGQGGEAAVAIGRLTFPDYDADALTGSTAWMKHVQLYIGQHQRLTGEVKKLPRPVAVIRRRDRSDARARDGGEGGVVGMSGSDEEAAEQLEVVEIVRHKLVFSQRPEPVGTATVG
jgi:chromosome transmission fidelity protein 8